MRNTKKLTRFITEMLIKDLLLVMMPFWLIIIGFGLTLGIKFVF